MIAEVQNTRKLRTESIQSRYSDFVIHDANAQTFRRDELVPLERHQLWMIDEGFIRTVNYSDSGDIVTLGLWGKGNVVGRCLSENHGYEAECLTSVTIRPTSINQVNLTEVRSQQVRQMETFLNILHCRPLTHRLWMLLSWLGEHHSQRSDSGRVLDMRLTHQAIAEMIGSTRVTVSRLLKDFETEGKVVRLSQQKILLRSS